MNIDVYAFENADGTSATDWTTQSLEAARDYAQNHYCKLITRTYEFADSELLEDHTYPAVAEENDRVLHVETGRAGRIHEAPNNQSGSVFIHWDNSDEVDEAETSLSDLKPEPEDEDEPNAGNWFWWTLNVGINEIWVADGFDLTQERAQDIFERELGFATSCEIKTEVTNSPDPTLIRIAQGEDRV